MSLRELDEICFLSDEEFEISRVRLSAAFVVCHPGKLNFNSLPAVFVKWQMNFTSKNIASVVLGFFCDDYDSVEINI